jgi:hypothetical protein
LVGEPQILIEDGFKTIGIFAWSLFLLSSAARIVKTQMVEENVGLQPEASFAEKVVLNEAFKSLE